MKDKKKEKPKVEKFVIEGLIDDDESGGGDYTLSWERK